MRFEINYIIKPGAILFSNLEDMKSMLNSYAEEKIVPSCACLYFFCSAVFSRSETEELCCM